MTDKEIHEFLEETNRQTPDVSSGELRYSSFLAEDPDAPVGLVLAGGGGKGAYQIGVLKALKEAGALEHVKAISGASIGAVNAMLYAMDDMEKMYRAWDDIDLLTVFDLDLEFTGDLLQISFSRDEMLELIGKYIDFSKIKNGPYDIYCSLCRVDNVLSVAEYRRIADYDPETIKKILLASTALPVLYEAVEIDKAYYRDGGICDNVPIQPLYDAGIRKFIVILLSDTKEIDTSKWQDSQFIIIRPSHPLGDLLAGTLNFTDSAIRFRELLGEKDGMRAIKTQFLKDDAYIRMEQTLAQNDYNEIKMRLQTETKMKTVGDRINSSIEKFNDIAKRYENL